MASHLDPVLWLWQAIVPSFTFVATAHACANVGLTVKLCDIDPETHTADPKSIESLITANTSVIVPVHCWGQVCDTAAINDIATRHGVKVGPRPLRVALPRAALPPRAHPHGLSDLPARSHCTRPLSACPPQLHSLWEPHHGGHGR